MEVIFEWKNSFDADSAEAYIDSLTTLIGEEGALKLVEIAGIYERHDWFKVLVAKNNNDVTGMLALYYEPIHGSHEGWICVLPKYRKYGVGDKIQEEFEKNAFKHGIRIFRADATLAYTHSQKFLYKKNYKAIGYTPMSFSFLPGKSLGSAVTVWIIFDPDLQKQWEEEKTETLDWDSRLWKVKNGA